MQEIQLSPELQAAVTEYTELRKQIYRAGTRIIETLRSEGSRRGSVPIAFDGTRLPHDVEVHLISDIFLNFVLRDGACKFLVDLTYNFKMHFSAWLVGTETSDQWPDLITEQAS